MPAPTPIWPAVVDDHGTLRLDDRDAFLRYVKTFAGTRVELVVRKRKSQRSLQQNRLLWRLLTILAEELGYDAHEREVLHYALLEKHYGKEFDERLGMAVLRTTSSGLDTSAFTEHIDWLVRFAASELHVVLPLPGEVD